MKQGREHREKDRFAHAGLPAAPVRLRWAKSPRRAGAVPLRHLGGAGGGGGQLRRCGWPRLHPDLPVRPGGASTDVCPANCLPYLLDALSGGYLTEQNEEQIGDTPCLRLALDTVGRSGAPVQCAVWLDKVTLIPLYGEFSQNGQVVLTVKMLSFTCQTEG